MSTRTALNIVDRLYAAAAGEITWDAALAATARHAGAALGLLLVPTRDGDVRRQAATGLTPPLGAEAGTGLAALFALGLSAQRGAAVLELDATTWLPDAGTALGCRHLLLMPLAADTPRPALLLLARPAEAGPFMPMQRERCNALRTHWQRALQLLGNLPGREGAAGLLARTLDALPSPLLLLDDERRVLQANRAARERLQACEVLTELRGRLVACGAEREAFEHDWTMMCADAASTGRAFGLRRNGDAVGLGLDATVLDDAGQRVWLLRLAENTASRQRLSAGWRTQFGLTGSECRVGLALIEYGDAVSIAAALGIADNTVRSHLKIMFAKTGVHSQTALALRLALPLRLVD